VPLAVGARESCRAAANAMRRAIVIVIAVVAIEVAIAVMVAVATEMAIAVLALAWARSVRGASGAAALPAPGLLV
jgi:hypothetical protein